MSGALQADGTVRFADPSEAGQVYGKGFFGTPGLGRWPEPRPVRSGLSLRDGTCGPAGCRGTCGRVADRLPTGRASRLRLRGAVSRLPGPAAAGLRGAREPTADRVHRTPPWRHAAQDPVPLLGRGDQRARPVRPRPSLRPGRTGPEREETSVARPGRRGIRPHVLSSTDGRPPPARSPPERCRPPRKAGFRRTG